MSYAGTVTFDGKPVGGVLTVRHPHIRTAPNELVDPGHVVLVLTRIADDPGQQALRENFAPDSRGNADLVVSPPAEGQQSITYEVWVQRISRGNPTTVTLKVSGRPVVS